MGQKSSSAKNSPKTSSSSEHSQNSKKPPPPKPKTLTDDPWREDISWTDEFEQDLLTEINGLAPKEKTNLLMIGPVGSGKSSFINAIMSIGKGRKYGMALIGDTGDKSCTSNFDGYTQTNLLRGYHLMDSMGIEASEKSGFHLDDIEFVIKGHVKKGYKFHPLSHITVSDKNEFYRSKPTLTDQCHCIIFVVSATAMHAGIQPAYIQKIKQIEERIRQEHVPQILVLTKVDVLCEEVEKDITKIYRSIKVMDAVKTASEVFGVEQSCIHPVKNYATDIKVEAKKNIPLLIALKQAMEYATDRIEYVLSNQNENDN